MSTDDGLNFHALHLVAQVRVRGRGRARARARVRLRLRLRLRLRVRVRVNFRALHLVAQRPLGAADAARPDEIEAEITEVHARLTLAGGDGGGGGGGGGDGDGGGAAGGEIGEMGEIGISLARMHEMSAPTASKLERRSAMARAAYLGFKMRLRSRAAAPAPPS
jgi:hypothetical protein